MGLLITLLPLPLVFKVSMACKQLHPMTPSEPITRTQTINMMAAFTGYRYHRGYIHFDSLTTYLRNLKLEV